MSRFTAHQRGCVIEQISPGHVVVKPHSAWQIADLFMQSDAVFPWIHSKNIKFATIASQQSDQDAQGCCFAGAVGSKEAKNGAARNLQVNPIERDERPIL